jgi:hypothetical protein
METTDVEIQGAIWSFSHGGDFEGSLIADDGYDGEPAEPIPKPIYNNFRAIVDVSGDAGVDLTNDSFDFVEFLGEPGGVSGDALDIAESFQLVAVAASGSTGTPGEGDKVGLILEPIEDGRIAIGEFVDSITLLPGPTTSFSDDFIL